MKQQKKAQEKYSLEEQKEFCKLQMQRIHRNLAENKKVYILKTQRKIEQYRKYCSLSLTISFRIWCENQPCLN